MNLINMKKPKEKVKETSEAPISSDEERYPWGLRLNLDDDELKKITSLKDIEAGATVSIEGIGKVVSVTVNDTEKEGKNRSVSIQIQQIAIADQGSGRAAFREATEK